MMLLHEVEPLWNASASAALISDQLLVSCRLLYFFTVPHFQCVSVCVHLSGVSPVCVDVYVSGV